MVNTLFLPELREMLATNDVAREGAIIQDEWASYAHTPHCVLALRLMSPGILDGNDTPGYMHPRTPLFRAAAGDKPAAIQRGRRETSRLIAGIIPCATGSIRCGAPPEVMDIYCNIDATRSPRYTGTREHDGAIPKISMWSLAQARLRARMGASGGVLVDGRLAL